MTTLSIPAGSGFGVANLPYGVYSRPTGGPGAQPRCATRVGDTVIDLAIALAPVLPQAEEWFARPDLNVFMAAGYDEWVRVRALLTDRVQRDLPEEALHAVGDVELHLPCQFADYVDFYASEHHASNLGRLFRPDVADPLLPNWKHLPVGYHGRSSTIVVSGVDIVRPCGQRKGPTDPSPVFGPSTRLDIEAEIGFIVGVGNPMGSPIPVEEAERHLFGAVIFNDWSARDIQAWEYQPLGPNLGKSFASSISPWVVPMLALAPAKCPVPGQDPTPLEYLRMAQPWTLDLQLEVVWNGQPVSRPPFAQMYWSPAQMLAHTTVNGAATRTGDIFASGTVSGPAKGQRGAFIELTWGGAEPVIVGGQERTFLEDGDTVTIRATAPVRPADLTGLTGLTGTGPDGTATPGEHIDFGEVTATVLPASP